MAKKHDINMIAPSAREHGIKGYEHPIPRKEQNTHNTAKRIADKKARQKKYESIDLYNNPMKLKSRKGYEPSLLTQVMVLNKVCMRLVASQHGKFVESWHNRA